MEQQSNKGSSMVFQNLTASRTAIWYMASKAFYFCDTNFFLIAYFFSTIPALSASISLLVSSSNSRKLWYTDKKKALSLDQWWKLCEARECFFFFYRYGPRQAQYQIRNQKSKLILHQNSWTEITISGELEQNVPQSFVSQMDRWGRHLLAVHEIKQISPRQKSQCPTIDPPY